MPYIDKNFAQSDIQVIPTTSEKLSSFLQKLFKLFINSVFGKAMACFEIGSTWN